MALAGRLVDSLITIIRCTNSQDYVITFDPSVDIEYDPSVLLTLAAPLTTSLHLQVTGEQKGLNA